MTGFFDRLEADLHEAALHPPRLRLVLLPLPAVAAALVVVLALAAALLALGGGGERRLESAPSGLSPVGTVISKGSGTPPRHEDSLVVATGRTKVSGPWQLEVYAYPAAVPRSTEAAMRAGHCLELYWPAPPGGKRPGLGGVCGPDRLSSARMAHFTLAQSMPPRRPAQIVWGRVPKRASKVVITAPGVRLETEPLPAPQGFKQRFGFDASFFVAAFPRGEGARVNWLDSAGRPGSRGIALAPPPD